MKGFILGVFAAFLSVPLLLFTIGLFCAVVMALASGH